MGQGLGNPERIPVILEEEVRDKGNNPPSPKGMGRTSPKVGPFPMPSPPYRENSLF